jgi:hypothetical protein
MRSANVALYQPYIHIRDETWLKAAALYWPKIARIVPPGYSKRDSDNVKMLDDALQLFHDVSPEPASVTKVGTEFGQLIHDHAAKLRAQCDIRLLNPRYVAHDRGSFVDGQAAYVYASKVADELIQHLEDESLGLRGRGHAWIGMHPELARVYMCALAAELSARYGLHPVTDQAIPFVAEGTWSCERIAAVILGEPALTNEAQPDVYQRVLVASVQLVLPANLAAIPMRRIIEVRQRSFHLYKQFRDDVSEHVARLGAAVTSDGGHLFLDADLRAEAELTVGGNLAKLDRELRSIGLDTVTSLVSVKTELAELPAVGAHLAHLPMVVQAGTAVAAGVAVVGRDTARRRQNAIELSPAGYLHELRGGLRPSNKVRRLLRHLRGRH